MTKHMLATELYERLTASTLARIYFELENAPEAEVVYKYGVANCGKADFDALVAEHRAEMEA